MDSKLFLISDGETLVFRVHVSTLRSGAVEGLSLNRLRDASACGFRAHSKRAPRSLELTIENCLSITQESEDPEQGQIGLETWINQKPQHGKGLAN